MAYTPQYETGDLDDMIYDLLGNVLAQIQSEGLFSVLVTFTLYAMIIIPLIVRLIQGVMELFKAINPETK